jgi:hypothetical protein
MFRITKFGSPDDDDDECAPAEKRRCSCDRDDRDEAVVGRASENENER